MTQRIHLAHARTMLGMAAAIASYPSLDANAEVVSHHNAIGVGAVLPPPVGMPAMRPAPNGRGMMTAPNGCCVPGAYTAQVPAVPAPQAQISLADRAAWASWYLAIEIPVDSRETEPDGVVAGAIVTLKPSSQVAVWITDFTVDTDEPCDFVISELTISRVNLVGGSGGIPATRFRQNSRRPKLNNEILSGGSFAKVVIQNVNKEATLDFFGSFEGMDLSKPMQQSL